MPDKQSKFGLTEAPGAPKGYDPAEHRRQLKEAQARPMPAQRETPILTPAPIADREEKLRRMRELEQDPEHQRRTAEYERFMARQKQTETKHLTELSDARTEKLRVWEQNVKPNVKGNFNWIAELAPNVLMTNKRAWQFRATYGDDACLEIPQRVSEWAERNRIGIGDRGYELCCKFADKRKK